MLGLWSSVAGSVGAAARATATVRSDCAAICRTAATQDSIAWHAPWSDGAQSVPAPPVDQDSDSAGIGMPAWAASASGAVSAHGEAPATSESWSTRRAIARAPKRRMEAMDERYGHGAGSAVSE